MKEELFLQKMLPRIGPSAMQNLNTAQLVAIRELLIKKSVFSRSEMTTETENQLGNIAKLLEKTPIPSPFQPQK